jgi:hypothetical protein
LVGAQVRGCDQVSHRSNGTAITDNRFQSAVKPNSGWAEISV